MEVEAIKDSFEHLWHSLTQRPQIDNAAPALFLFPQSPSEVIGRCFVLLKRRIVSRGLGLLLIQGLLNHLCPKLFVESSISGLVKASMRFQGRCPY
jgi:hypothetical protein